MSPRKIGHEAQRIAQYSKFEDSLSSPVLHSNQYLNHGFSLDAIADFSTGDTITVTWDISNCSRLLTYGYDDGSDNDEGTVDSADGTVDIDTTGWPTGTITFYVKYQGVKIDTVSGITVSGA